MERIRRFAISLMMAALLAGAVGCVAEIGAAPPPDQVEVVGIAPYPGEVWIGGYWSWSYGRYVWVPGYWARRPWPRAVWAPGRWRKVRRGWRWTPGRWR